MTYKKTVTEYEYDSDGNLTKETITEHEYDYSTGGQIAPGGGQVPIRPWGEVNPRGLPPVYCFNGTTPTQLPWSTEYLRAFPDRWVQQVNITLEEIEDLVGRTVKVTGE